MSALVETYGLGKRYRGADAPALRGVDLQVRAGEVLGVVGPNGAGKTTLFGCLMGLLHYDGMVHLHGLDPREAEARRGCGYVPERLTFDPYFRAEDLVEHHYRLGGGAEAGRPEAVGRALERVGLAPEDRRRRVRTLSRGNLQRLALAQAIVAGPDVLFLDEPTSGMDPLGVTRFKALVRELAAGGCAVVFNSHQLSQVEDLSDRVVFLDHGRVASERALERERRGVPLRLRWLGPADAPARLQRLARRLKAESVPQSGPGALFQVKDQAAAAAFIALAVRAGVRLSEARQSGEDLESTFTRLFRSPA